MEKEVIICPNCSKEFEIRACSSINLNEEPFRLKQILNGKINVYKCPKCKTEVKYKSHILVTKIKDEVTEWYWLVSKKHQEPTYKETLLKTILPNVQSTGLIQQHVVFVDFGKPEEGLKFVLGDQKPQSESDWISLGKILAGEEAIRCFQKALRINSKNLEAKTLLHQELDKLKTYS